MPKANITAGRSDKANIKPCLAPVPPAPIKFVLATVSALKLTVFAIVPKVPTNALKSIALSHPHPVAVAIVGIIPEKKKIANTKAI
jgi:hypothetical protein